jgi:hypothetical protein
MLLVAASTSLPDLLQKTPSAWLLAAPHWIAIGGAFAYAYGWRARPLWVWRAFALLYNLFIMIGLGRMAGLMVGTGRAAPGSVDGWDWTGFAVAVLICWLVCIALLRHARLLRGAERRMAQSYERIFA